jgi:hypothetical protein
MYPIMGRALFGFQRIVHVLPDHVLHAVTVTVHQMTVIPALGTWCSAAYHTHNTSPTSETGGAALARWCRQQATDANRNAEQSGQTLSGWLTATLTPDFAVCPPTQHHQQRCLRFDLKAR